MSYTKTVAKTLLGPGKRGTTRMMYIEKPDRNPIAEITTRSKCAVVSKCQRMAFNQHLYGFHDINQARRSTSFVESS